MCKGFREYKVVYRVFVRLVVHSYEQPTSDALWRKQMGGQPPAESFGDYALHVSSIAQIG